jgi:hypothetical protein
MLSGGAGAEVVMALLLRGRGRSAHEMSLRRLGARPRAHTGSLEG